MNAKLFNELYSRGVSSKGYYLLIAIRDRFLMDIKGADIQKDVPFIFASSNDIKAGYEELVSASIINAVYDRGNISSISINRELIAEITKEEPVKIKRERKPKEPVSPPEKDPILDIILYYNSFELLPRPASATQLARANVKNAVEQYGENNVMNAIEYASKQQWLIDKGDEIWCSMNWIIRNIGNFMEGGKYFNTKKQEIVKTSSVLDTYKKDDIIIM